MTELRLYHGVSKPDSFLAQILTTRLLAAKQQVVVMTENPKQASQLDDRLWTISDTGFIPHCLIGHAYESSVPVVVTHLEAGTPPVRDVMISYVGKMQDYSSYLHYITILREKLAAEDEFHCELAAQSERGHTFKAFDLSSSQG